MPLWNLLLPFVSDFHGERQLLMRDTTTATNIRATSVGFMDSTAMVPTAANLMEKVQVKMTRDAFRTCVPAAVSLAHGIMVDHFRTIFLNMNCFLLPGGEARGDGLQRCCCL